MTRYLPGQSAGSAGVHATLQPWAPGQQAEQDHADALQPVVGVVTGTKLIGFSKSMSGS